MKLIDKDDLVAEIENIESSALCEYKSNKSRYAEGSLDVTHRVKHFLDTLEVKEVDLDFQRFAKEMDAIFALPSSKTKNTEEEPLNWEYAIAKHFFELGIKAQKEPVSIWHDANQQPTMYRKYLVRYSDGRVNGSWERHDDGFISWKDVVKEHKFTHWCYTEDLLKL